MPHLVLEISRNLEASLQEANVLVRLRDVTIASALFDASAVKARVIAFDNIVLEPPATSFAHVNLSILSGRPADKLASLSDALFATLKAALPQADMHTVNLHEMNPATYRK